MPVLLHVIEMLLVIVLNNIVSVVSIIFDHPICFERGASKTLKLFLVARSRFELFSISRNRIGVELGNEAA